MCTCRIKLQIRRCKKIYAKDKNTIFFVYKYKSLGNTQIFNTRGYNKTIFRACNWGLLHCVCLNFIF